MNRGVLMFAFLSLFLMGRKAKASEREESIKKTFKVKKVAPMPFFKTAPKKLPRGLRNKNPGNLRITKIKWKGKIPVEKNTDGGYEQFTHDIFGIRAMVMDIKNDITKDGLNTLNKLMAEYAPKFENPTESYIRFISKKLGIGANENIRPKHYLGLVKALIQFENGQQPYSDSLILAAIKDAYSQ